MSATDNSEITTTPSKRGRKPVKNKNYFREAEEDAVLRYISTDDAIEKNDIFQATLQPAFIKMIESIIRRYKLYVPGEEFDEIFDDTMSFLLTKMDKFTPGKYKAYSYYGTICKNYLIGRIQAYNKTLVRNPSYDTIDDEIVNSIKYSSNQDSGARMASEIITNLTKRIQCMLSNPTQYDLKENEIKVGEAIVNLFDNWDYVLSTEGSKKLNKSAVLFFLRESTGLDTKSIRDNMRKYRKEFSEIKNMLVSV